MYKELVWRCAWPGQWTKIVLQICCGLTLFWVGSECRAERDPQSVAAAIAPYWKQEYAILVHAELKQMSAAQVERAIRGFAKKLDLPVEPTSLQSLAPAETVRKFLVASGVESVYLVASMDQFTRGQLLFYLPTPSPQVSVSAVEQINRFLGNTAPQTWVTTILPHGVVVCSPDRQQELNAQPDGNKSADKLQKAFAPVSKYPLKIALLPETERRTLQGLNPPLPPELGISAREIAEMAEGASVGLSLDEAIGVKLVVEATTPQAAQRLAATVERLGALVAKTARPDIPTDKIASAWSQLSLTADGSQLVREVPDLLKVEDMFVALRPAVVAARLAAKHSVSVNNLKQLALAVHSFADFEKGLPPSASYDDQNRPLLSWRVFLLPYLGQEALFKEFRLNESWDSEHNRKLIPRMPQLFLSTGLASAQDGKTCYLAPVGPTLMFNGPVGRGFADVVDGTSMTILFAEVAPEHAVIWTQPTDWQVDLQKPKEKLLRADAPVVRVAFVDGSVHALQLDKLDDETLRRILEINDGKIAELP